MDRYIACSLCGVIAHCDEVLVFWMMWLWIQCVVVVIYVTVNGVAMVVRRCYTTIYMFQECTIDIVIDTNN